MWRSCFLVDTTGPTLRGVARCRTLQEGLRWPLSISGRSDDTMVFGSGLRHAHVGWPIPWDASAIPCDGCARLSRAGSGWVADGRDAAAIPSVWVGVLGGRLATTHWWGCCSWDAPAIPTCLAHGCRAVPFGTLCDTMRWVFRMIMDKIRLGCRRSGRFDDTIRVAGVPLATWGRSGDIVAFRSTSTLCDTMRWCRVGQQGACRLRRCGGTNGSGGGLSGN